MGEHRGMEVQEAKGGIRVGRGWGLRVRVRRQLRQLEVGVKERLKG